MHSFTDKEHRIWNLDVTVGSIRRVRAMTGMDLFNVVRLESDTEPDTGILDRLTSEPDTITDVLYSVCKPDADRLSVTPEQFSSGMDGAVLESATAALLADILDFFPEAKRRTISTIIQARRRFAEERTGSLADAVTGMFTQWTASLQRSPDA